MINQNDVSSIKAFWQAMNQQQWDKLLDFFLPEAIIDWPNTQERFSVTEFVALNRNYPGNWAITVEQIIPVEDSIITVVSVKSLESSASFHAVSFFTFSGSKIISLQEYWSEDGDPPPRDFT